MNIFKKISAAATIFAVAMMSSCSDKGYWEAAPAEQGLSFECATYNETLAPGANEIVIPIIRSAAGSEETVALTFTPGKNSPADITVPGSVTFAAGSNTADIVVKIANATPPFTYSGTIQFDADKASYSGIAAIDLKCPVNYTWSSLGTGEFLDAWVMGDADPYPVEILQADGFKRYRVLNPYKAYYASDAAKVDWGDWIASSGPAYIEFWENETGGLSFNSFETGLNYQAVSGQGINAYAWNEQNWYNVNGDFDLWYQPGFAVLSPIYFIPSLSGGFGQVQFAIQISLPE